MPSSKKVTKRSSDSRSLLHRILVAIYDFTGRMIDQEQLESTADEIEKALDKNYPTLAISSLFINDIEKIIKLKWTRKDTELADLRPMECPPVLVQQIDKITRALGRSHPSEENGRWILNSLLLEAYEIATVICPHAAQPLNIQAERGWKYGPVKWHRRKYFLTGRPDYGVWYGEEEAVSLNVVIVEAKRELGGMEQALGYMGTKKKDCTIYGIASNGYDFVFLKIDNDSKWSDRKITTRDGNYDEVLGVLVHMFTKAAVMSPAHSKEPPRQQQSSGESAATKLSVQEDVEMAG
ncbi:hypothetical protein E8E15_004461 [Penicillium rubens]|nr:hypothetical protein E8E15_004461 [Penicillium rubens]KAJ5037813.1 hypothetical protein NUH16_011414 [Penicillium rubens]